MRYAVYLAPDDLARHYGRDTWVSRAYEFNLVATLVAEGPEEAYTRAQNGPNTFGWDETWVQRDAVRRRHAPEARSLFVGDVIARLGRYHKREKDIVVRRRGFDYWEPRRDTTQDIRARQKEYLKHPNVDSPETLRDAEPA